MYILNKSAQKHSIANLDSIEYVHKYNAIIAIIGTYKQAKKKIYVLYIYPYVTHSNYVYLLMFYYVTFYKKRLKHT